MKIIVTIPAYNEEKTLPKVIEEVNQAMKTLGYDYQVLVIDDGSNDRTGEVAGKAGADVFYHQVNLGLAEAFRTEMKLALQNNADIIVHIDADGQYRGKDISKLIRPIIEKKADIVLGSRFRGHIEKMSFIKKIGNIAFSKVLTSITGKRITDGQTGFRAFTKEVAGINIISRHTYTQEQVIKSIKSKYRLVEVPVYFAERKGKSRLIKHPLSYAAKAWINIIRIYRDYEPLKFFGIIGGLFLFLGSLLGILILATLINKGVVGGIPRVILSGLFITTGIQILLFGFLADMKK
ncbi:glycosyltransferase [Candidatus Woesearchaeota archaeon]|nr:glycosyltransferase [Candidatus Woesearchaeota archaeon]